MSTQLDPSQLLGFRHIGGTAISHAGIATQADRSFNRVGENELTNIDRAFSKISLAEASPAPVQVLDRLFNKIGGPEVL